MEIVKYQPGVYRSLKPGELDPYPELVEEEYCYTITQSYYLKIRQHGKEYEIIVPERFLTDGASMSPDISSGWVFHDYLYATCQFYCGTQCKREQADQIMSLIAKSEGHSWYAIGFDWLSWWNPCGIFATAHQNSSSRGAQFLPDNLELY